MPMFRLWNELILFYGRLDRAHKLFIFYTMLLSFFITGEACITKAVSISFFLNDHGANNQPLAWLCTIPAGLLTVWIYNHFLFRIGPLKMLWISTLIGSVVNMIAALFVADIPSISFALYVWKDLYIMLMFQQLWALIHATIDFGKAKLLYGVIFGVGGLGSVVASGILGSCAVAYGSDWILFCTIPILFLIAIGYHFALKVREGIEGIQDIRPAPKDLEGGWALIFKSPLLKMILCIVAGMQIIATLLDFNFSAMIKAEIPHIDERTRFLGLFFATVNGGSLILQFIGAFLFVKLMGLRGSHLFVPGFLSFLLLTLFVTPFFPVMLVTFAGLKAMDYSIFAIIKEMLYIPLKVEEKFKAKAIIDVFIYRSSKAFASLLILGMLALFEGDLFHIVTLTALILSCLWFLYLILRFHKVYIETDMRPGYGTEIQ